MSAANAQTLKATWSACDDCGGYRVYKYENGEKLLLQEGYQTFFETEISESIVLGVAAYNDAGESEVIPRLVVIEKPKPAIVKITVEVE